MNNFFPSIQLPRTAIALSFLVAFTDVSQAVSAAAFKNVNVPYDVGPILADRTQNFVYMVDATDNLLLKIDTAAGVVAVAAPIDDGATSGEMALSVDDTTLYLAESDTNEILVFSTENLELQSIIPLSYAPQSIAAGANGRLFAASYDPSGYFGYINELDTTTGAVLQSFGNLERYYYSPVLRTDASGTNLYATIRGISGYMDLYEYNISGTTASTATAYYYLSANLEDFVPDESHGIIYLSQGGDYGLDTLKTSSDYEQLWTFASGTPYGTSCSFSANSPFVFAGSGSAEIEEFYRGSNTPVTDTVVSDYSHEISGLAATPNGRAIYYSHPFEEQVIAGIVGLSHLDLTVPYIQPFNPADHPLAYNQYYLQARAYRKTLLKEEAIQAAKEAAYQ